MDAVSVADGQARIGAGGRLGGVYDLLWSVLENAGVPVAVRGFGRLFDDRQPDGNKTKER